MLSKDQMDDPLARLITLLQSAENCMTVGQQYIRPQIHQLRALRARLQEQHGKRWWDKLNVPPLWKAEKSKGGNN